MRAVRYHQYGGVENLVVEEVPEPHPGPGEVRIRVCLLYTSPSPRDQRGSRMPSSA